MPEIGPAPVLALLVGVLHCSVYVMLRGSGRARLPFLALAAILGAYAGQALGSRLGDPVRIGDFGLLGSSLVAWIGIGIVAIMSTLGPTRGRPSIRPPGRG